MISEKLEDQINWLERAAKRSNSDLHDITLRVLGNMRAEVARVRALETSGVIVMPEQEGNEHVTA